MLARPVLAAWALTFAGTLFELPVSQLLYPPDHPPVAIGITKALANYDFGGGTAMELCAVVLALAVVTVAFGGSQNGTAVQVRGAVKRYGAVHALAGIDLEVAAGRFLVLLGPSGPGTSTLIRTLAGVERLDEGEVRTGDQVVGDSRRHVAPEPRDLAMVFQDYALWPHLTVLGNVGYALRRRRLRGPEAARRCGEVLERVGLGALAERYRHELSGGEQQRVALARAVVARPVEPGRGPA